jgi:hypothetical protein
VASSSHCDLCGTEIVQGSCQNPDCKNCSCFFGGEDDTLPPLPQEKKAKKVKKKAKK